MGGILTVSGSIFSNNTAQGNGGAIYDYEGKQSITNSKFISNSAAFGDGIYNEITTTRITNNCFVTNGEGVRLFGVDDFNINENFWGANDGPSGAGPGSGDAIINAVPTTFLSVPNFANFSCPTILPDFYSVSTGVGVPFEVLATSSSGLLVNDIGVLANSAAVLGTPDAGTVTVSANGGFTYTPTNLTNPVDGFRYTAEDISDGTQVTGLVCITRSNLSVTVPPTQTTTLGTPIPIPNVRVASNGDTGATEVVSVKLTIPAGTLNVSTPDNGSVSIPPSEACRTLLNSLRIASNAEFNPSVVSGEDTLPERNRVSLAESGFARPQRVSTMALQTGVDVIGNGTGTLTLEGPINEVNVVLSTLVYTPSQVGIFPLTVVANNGTTGIAVGSFNVVVSTGSGTVSSGSTSGSALFAPSGPLTLAEFNGTPGSVIRGSAPGGAVNNGDVYVRLIAVNGTLRVSPEQLGDPFLINSIIGNGAEVFGLTFTGLPVSAFNAPVRICLLGGGSVYYRDATASPRITLEMNTIRDGGYTCATIPNSGTLVLVTDGSQAAATPLEGAVPLTDCMVSTRAIMNLRQSASPTAAIIRLIPFDVALTAFTRQAGFYDVDYLGTRGWLSGTFLTLGDGC
jgi:hypothetical protein